jgi:phosphoserine phosphatase RsbU/P
MEEFTKMVEPESVKDDLASARSCADCDEHTQEAKLMQSSLLPTKGLCHESVEIAFRFIPFSAVRGDSVDFFHLPDGLIGICLGDVVGTGLSAAMSTALVMGILRGIHKTGTDTL